MKNKKGFTLVEIMIVVVIIGLLAAMAIPAFNKVRENSRLSAMENNLRQIAAAGQQYILEEGLDSVDYGDLEGTYFQPITTVAGEDYTGLTVSQTGGTLTASDGTQTARFTY
ncbi:MAG: type IV pilin protein [Opitutales bacterium]